VGLLERREVLSETTGRSRVGPRFDACVDSFPFLPFRAAVNNKRLGQGNGKSMWVSVGGAVGES